MTELLCCTEVSTNLALAFQKDGRVEMKKWRVEGCALIFSWENTKITTSCWTTIDRRILFSYLHFGRMYLPKEDALHSRAKEKPQQDGRRDKITSRIKPQTSQRYLEGANKILCAPGPRERSIDSPTRNWVRHAFECLSLSWGGTGQQWSAVGTGALSEAGLRGTACGISPPGGGHH